MLSVQLELLGPTGWTFSMAVIAGGYVKTESFHKDNSSRKISHSLMLSVVQ